MGMKFKQALEEMKKGIPMKLPSWGGYWCWDDEKQTIIMYTKDNQRLDIRETQRVEYTLQNILSEEWIPADGNNCPILEGELKMSFGVALELLKKGVKVAREGWNGKGLFVVYQKAYPQGIPCNKQTAEVWGLKEGDLFKCEPYLQINTVDGSHAMWAPSIRDCLANDWVIVE